jgi:hypothetical protein
VNRFEIALKIGLRFGSGLPQLVESRPNFTSETSPVSSGAALAALAATRCSAGARELERGLVIRSGALYCSFECAQSGPPTADG